MIYLHFIDEIFHCTAGKMVVKPNHESGPVLLCICFLSSLPSNYTTDIGHYITTGQKWFNSDPHIKEFHSPKVR